jgi:hypothetical protein
VNSLQLIAAILFAAADSAPSSPESGGVWQTVKEVFWAIGSFAGLFAFIRPVFETRFSRDNDRAKQILEIFPESQAVELESLVYQFRRVRSEIFRNIDRIYYARRNGEDLVRFSGALAKPLLEIDGLLAAYARLRSYIQVPEWEPRRSKDLDGDEYDEWQFNKQAFAKGDGIPRDYAKHLDDAGREAEELKKAYQRFQIVCELHLLEAPFASRLLKRRFKKANL